MKEPTLDELAEWFPWATDRDLKIISSEKLYLCSEEGRLIYLYDGKFDIHSETGMRKRARNQYYRYGEKKLKAMEEARLKGAAPQMEIFD